MCLHASQKNDNKLKRGKGSTMKIKRENKILNLITDRRNIRELCLYGLPYKKEISSGKHKTHD